jgi:hypothetical protein
MVRVSLLFRGVAVLLLAASAAAAQTPEPPAEFLSLDSFGPSSPDLLRQFSADARHPLLALMVDGELTSFDVSAGQDSSKQDSSKIKPTPQKSSTAPKTDVPDGAIVLDGDGTLGGDGCGGLLEGCGLATACPMVPNLLPLACPPPPPPCCCRKCQRKFGHRHCGGCGCGYGAGYGNPYLGWPCCPAWCFYGAPLVPGNQGCCGRGRCWRKHSCGCGYGYPYCDGYGGWDMGYDGFADGGFCGCYMPPPPCSCRKCQRHNRHCCGYGYGYSYGGWMDGGFCGCYMPPPPPPCCCRRCQRKHGCSYGYGYPGWDDCYGGMYPYYGCGYGCGRHHGGLFQRRRCCQPPPYPYCPAPMMMPCMDAGPFCADCAFGGDGIILGGGDGIILGGDSVAMGDMVN